MPNFFDELKKASDANASEAFYVLLIVGNSLDCSEPFFCEKGFIVFSYCLVGALPQTPWGISLFAKSDLGLCPKTPQLFEKS